MAEDRFLRLGTFHRVGFVPPSSPNVIPPDPAYTTYLSAGCLSIGVETRLLPGREKEFKGPSIHILDVDTGLEHLRFDVFDGLPHYHYIEPGVVDNVVAFDHAAHGDMWTWTIECLRSRIPDMLRQAGNDALADRVDVEAVRALIPEIIELAMVPDRIDAPRAPEWSSTLRGSPDTTDPTTA